MSDKQTFRVIEYASHFEIEHVRTGHQFPIGDGVDVQLMDPDTGEVVLVGEPGFCELWTREVNAYADEYYEAYFPHLQGADAMSQADALGWVCDFIDEQATDSPSEEFTRARELLAEIHAELVRKPKVGKLDPTPYQAAGLLFVELRNQFKAGQLSMSSAGWGSQLPLNIVTYELSYKRNGTQKLSADVSLKDLMTSESIAYAKGWIVEKWWPIYANEEV